YSRFFCPLETDETGNGEIVVTRHLHVSVLGIYPDINTANIAQVARDDSEFFGGVFDRVTVSITAADHARSIGNFEVETFIHVTVGSSPFETRRNGVADSGFCLFVALAAGEVVLDGIHVGDVEGKSRILVPNDDGDALAQ